jgi:Prohead core protein serine protease
MTKQLFVEESGIPFTIERMPPAIREAVDKTGHLVLRGVPATVLDELNGNERKYTRREMQKAIGKVRKAGHFESRRLLCSANDHPEESYVPPASASHVILDAYTKEKGDKVYLLNDMLVLSTDSGKNLKALVDAGASFGTSIRGLGQLNEETKCVENYDWLGTDFVGNPSAGTYANKSEFKVEVESASSTLINQVTEQIKGKSMSFNLQEAITEFKTKHYKWEKTAEGLPISRPPQVTRELTSDYIEMQRKAIEADVDQADLDALTDEIYGQAKVEPTPPKKTNEQKAGEDVVNKTKRELEATQNLAIHLQTQIKELEDYKSKTTREIAAYEKVAVAL